MRTLVRAGWRSASVWQGRRHLVLGLSLNSFMDVFLYEGERERRGGGERRWAISVCDSGPFKPGVKGVEVVSQSRGLGDRRASFPVICDCPEFVPETNSAGSLELESLQLRSGFPPWKI